MIHLNVNLITLDAIGNLMRRSTVQDGGELIRDHGGSFRNGVLLLDRPPPR